MLLRNYGVATHPLTEGPTPPASGCNQRFGLRAHPGSQSSAPPPARVSEACLCIAGRRRRGDIVQTGHWVEEGLDRMRNHDWFPLLRPGLRLGSRLGPTAVDAAAARYDESSGSKPVEKADGPRRIVLIIPRSPPRGRPPPHRSIDGVPDRDSGDRPHQDLEISSRQLAPR